MPHSNTDPLCPCCLPQVVASNSARALAGVPSLSECWLPRKERWGVQLTEEVGQGEDYPQGGLRRRWATRLGGA